MGFTLSLLGIVFSSHTSNSTSQAPVIPYGEPSLEGNNWRMNIMRKLKYFFWRILSKEIGASTRVNSRGMDLDSLCQRCGLEPETIMHGFCTCSECLYLAYFKSTFYESFHNFGFA